MTQQDPSIEKQVADAVEDYLDGQLDADRLEALRALLMENADARQAFSQYNSLTQLIASSPVGAGKVKSVVPRGGLRHEPKFANRVPGVLAVLAASLFIAACFVAFNWKSSGPVAESTGGNRKALSGNSYEVALRPESSEPPVAVLLNVENAEWNSQGLGNVSGIPLRPGWLDLNSGSASILFDCGAVTTLIGPARFRIHDSHQAFLASGSMVANVPEKARGFKVRTQSMQLTDLGTEFGIRIGDADETEVHVINGLVEVECDTPSNAKTKLEMRENEAKKFAREVEPGSVPMDNSLAEKVVVSRPKQRIGYYTFRSMDNGDGTWTTDPSPKTIGGAGAKFGDFFHVGVEPGPVEFTKNLNRWSFKSWREQYRPMAMYVGFKVNADQGKRLNLKRLSLELFRAGGNLDAGLAPQHGKLLVSSDGFKTQHAFTLLANEDFVLRPKFVSADLASIPTASEFELRFVFKGQSKARAMRLDEVTLDLELVDSTIEATVLD